MVFETNDKQIAYTTKDGRFIIEIATGERKPFVEEATPSKPKGGMNIYKEKNKEVNT